MLQDLPFTDLQVARERLDRWLSLAIAFANESARDERQWMIGMLFWDARRRRLGDEWSDPIRPLFVELAAVRDRPVRVGDIIAASASQTLVQVDNRLRLWLITCGFHRWLDAAIVLTESTLRRELILGDDDDFMGFSWALSMSWRQEPIDFPDPQWRRVAERLRTDSPFWEAGAAVQAENFAKHVRETLDLDPWQMGAELDLEFSKASQRRLAVDANPPSKSEPQAIYLGNRQCRVGDGPPITLDETADTVLQGLLDLRGGGDKGMLCKATGEPNAPRILARIRERHPELAPFIFLPGGRGKGGYRTTIKDGRRG